MTFYKPVFSFLFLIIISLQVFCQQVGIGQWRDHLPYHKTIATAKGNNIVFAATPNNVFSYEINDGNLTRYSKVNGLSDVSVSTLNYDNSLEILMIGYKNGNIDLLKNGRIINIPDIKRKSISGLKSINKIYFRNKLAYLACGFGIVVLDPVKEEVKESYLIGNNSSTLNVYDFTANDTSYFAATEKGIFYADINNPNLINYQNWNTLQTYDNPNNAYSIVKVFNNYLIVSKVRENNQPSVNYYSDGTSWQILDTNGVFKYEADGNKLISAHWGFLTIRNAQLQAESWVVNPGGKVIIPLDIIADNQGYWIADEHLGLVNINKTGTAYNSYFPNGPTSTSGFKVSAGSGNVFFVQGGRDDALTRIWSFGVVNRMVNDNWISYLSPAIPGLDTIFDFVNVQPHPSDPAHFYASSWGHGLAEFKDNKLVNFFNETNSSLQPARDAQGNRLTLRTDGLAFDEGGNLWVVNSLSAKALSVRYTNGNWESFDLSTVTTGDITSIVIDQNNYKWILCRGNKIAVFNQKNNQQQLVWVNPNKGSDMQTGEVHSIAVDHEGEIWLGTDKGIKVIYSPGSAFKNGNSGESSIQTQTILVVQGGYVQHLLESELINSIAIDGANRKWFGTQKGGAFLMSADGTKEILHFTTENSPLPTNAINSIAIEPTTGEVFFGTDYGVYSYRGTATEGFETHENVVAYPNPVEPGYNGSIAIKGLVSNAQVKITDAYGNLVYQLKADGGQAVWNGKNHAGKRVSTGVYLVFSMNETGEETFVTKILFIN
jgi:hypothetical protein